MLHYANQPCADTFTELSIWGQGNFVVLFLEAEIKSLLPLHEEKYCILDLQLIGSQIEGLGAVEVGQR